MDRKKEIIKVSIHGILANLLLVMFKAAVVLWRIRSPLCWMH